MYKEATVYLDTVKYYIIQWKSLNVHNKTHGNMVSTGKMWTLMKVAE